MRAALTLAFVLAACGDDRALLSGSDDGTSTSTTSSSPSETTSIADATTGTSTAASSSSTGSTESSSGADETAEGCAFLCAPDLGEGMNASCDIFVQDCPRGMKCMPWADDGGNIWNATRCVPIADEPRHLGEPCTVEGTLASGIDDCELRAMCWYVDEAGNGTCVDMCRGDANEQVCLDPATHCTINQDATLLLCLPLCDPLLQDCDDATACYEYNGWFSCMPVASDGEGSFGDPCDFVSGCDRGLFCDELGVPDCAGSTGCCNAYCDLTANDPDAACPGSAQGQICAPWFEPGHAPPGLASVGRCTAGA